MVVKSAHYSICRSRALRPDREWTRYGQSSEIYDSHYCDETMTVIQLVKIQVSVGVVLQN